MNDWRKNLARKAAEGACFIIVLLSVGLLLVLVWFDARLP